MSRYADVSLGKGVVRCKDRPGFIANRLGVYWLQAAVVEAFDMAAREGFDIEEADAIIGRPMGIPKTGVFGLLDLVGLDLMPHVNASMAASLPADDPFHALNRPLPLIERLIAEGYTGRKGKGGFYRINREKGKQKEAIDLVTGQYPSGAQARDRGCRSVRAQAEPSARPRQQARPLRLAGARADAGLRRCAGGRRRRRGRGHR